MPLLVVQRGHCYRTRGATGTTGEQAYASSVANACVNLLHGKGGWRVKAILADEDPTAYRGDAFVAIHCDGSTNPSARGASIGYRNRAGQLFGQAWKRAYAARGWTGGFRPDNYTAALQGYYGTGTAAAVGNTRAFIAECGFRTNAQDRALLDGPGGPTRVALAIGDALGIHQPHTEEDDMPTAREVADAILNTQLDMGWKPRGSTETHKATVRTVLSWEDRRQQSLANQIAAVTGKVDGLAEAVRQLGAGQDIDIDAVTAAAEAGTRKALAEGVVQVDIDVTGPTTEGN